MITKVDLHLRADPAGEHHSLGAVAVEHDGPRLAPYEDIACSTTGRHIRGHVTSIHERSGHLPHVYADEVHADELVD